MRKYFLLIFIRLRPKTLGLPGDEGRGRIPPNGGVEEDGFGRCRPKRAYKMVPYACQWGFITIFVFLFLFNFIPVQAEDLQGQVMGQIKAGADKAELGEPLAPQSVVAEIIKVILGLTGMIFTGLIVYGGFNFITAHGEEEKIKKAQNIIKASVIGLIIVLLAYSITIFISSRISQSVTSGVEVMK